MKLLIQPFLEAHPLHAFNVPGPRAESQAIQRVQNLIVFRELLLEQLGLKLGFVRWLGRFSAGGA
jgi:hypothetical protein